MLERHREEKRSFFEQGRRPATDLGPQALLDALEWFSHTPYARSKARTPKMALTALLLLNSGVLVSFLKALLG